MHCSKCGAVLADDAKYCGSCGAATDGTSATGGAANVSNEKPTKKSNKGCLITAAVVAAILFLIFAFRDATPVPADGATVPTAEVQRTTVTAAELFNAYQDNEAAAQAAYGDRPLLVTGTVDSVTLDFGDDPVIMLKTANQFMSAQAALSEDARGQATSITKGQQISLKCDSVSEVAGTPMLRNCSL